MRRIDYWHVKFPVFGLAVNFPNQVWSIDITYISMPMCHMYLAAIIDWYSRKIVGHYLSDTLDTEPVIHTVKEAIAMHGIPAILNSDQRCQFTSAEYKVLLKGLQIRHRVWMGRAAGQIIA